MKQPNKIDVNANDKNYKIFWREVRTHAKRIREGQAYKVQAVRFLLMGYEASTTTIREAFKDFEIDISRRTICDARKQLSQIRRQNHVTEVVEALDDGELKEPSPPHSDWETLSSAATFVREAGGFEAAFKVLNTVRNLQIGQTNTA